MCYTRFTALRSNTVVHRTVLWSLHILFINHIVQLVIREGAHCHTAILYDPGVYAFYDLLLLHLSSIYAVSVTCSTILITHIDIMIITM